MQLFKKKKEQEEDIEEEKLDLKPDENITVQVTKIGAKVESLLDIRKAYSEKFGMLSEQIGELRGMILDSNRQIQQIEIKSTKATELVSEVEPEKLMKEVRKQEQKTEALSANVESQQAVMNDITEELKKIRKQMAFYRGLEQVSKLNEEIKKDLINIKKVQLIVERHSDKVESIFIDLQKKYGELDAYANTLEDITKSNKEIMSYFDKIKISMDEKAEKKQFIDLSNKLERFLTETRESNIKNFTEKVENLIKEKEASQETLQKMHQKLDDLEITFEEAKVHKINVKMENLEKSLSLLHIEISNQKDIIRKLSKAKSDMNKVSRMINSYEEIAAKQELAAKKSNRTNYLIKKLEKRIQTLEKASALTALSAMDKDLGKLQKTYKKAKKKSKPRKKKVTAKKRTKKRK